VASIQTDVVLVVEDSKSMQGILRRLFASDGLEVRIAPDGVAIPFGHVDRRTGPREPIRRDREGAMLLGEARGGREAITEDVRAFAARATDKKKVRTKGPGGGQPHSARTRM